MAGLDARKAIALQFDTRQPNIKGPDLVGAAKRGFNFGQEIAREFSRDPVMERQEREAKLKKAQTANRAQELENQALELSSGLKDAAGVMTTILANTEENSPERAAALQDPSLRKHLGNIDPSKLSDDALRQNIAAIETKLNPIESAKLRMREQEDATRRGEGQANRDFKQEKFDREMGHKLKEYKLNKRKQEFQESKLSPQDAELKQESLKAWRQSTKQVAEIENLLDKLEGVEDSKFSGKLAGGVQQFFKDFLNVGDDDLQRFTQQFQDVSVTEATSKLKGLGPMTERELDLALSASPKSTDDPAVIQEWLMAKAKAARLESEYQEFTAEYIEDKGNSNGLIDAWQKHAVEDWEKSEKIKAKSGRGAQQADRVEIRPGTFVTPEENAAIAGYAEEVGITLEEALQELGL